MIGREESVRVIETAIDDMNPEIYPYLIERLIRYGALDAFATPVIMKKGRPANLLSVTCREESLEAVMKIIFQETTTLGVRIREEKRRVLRRSFSEVQTPWGAVKIKAGYLDEEDGEPVQLAPEYEDCKRIAEEKNIPLKEVYAAACSAAERTKGVEK